MEGSGFQTDTQKEEYRKFCREKGDCLPIFIRDWYLDATVADGAEWRVIYVKDQNHIIAAFPFQYSKTRTRFGTQLYKIGGTFQMIHGGLWIEEAEAMPSGKKEKRLIEIVNQVVDSLPPYDSFRVQFGLDFTDWTPFYWRGFQQTTYYTYAMDPKNYSSEEELFNSFHKYRRMNLRKAQKRYTVEKIGSGEVFYDFLEDAYREKKKELSYSRECFLRLDHALEKRNARIIYFAKDMEGDVSAADYLVCDRERRYSIFGSFRQQAVGARELLSWTGMKECFWEKIIYDFEGSMIPGVAEYNRRFCVEKNPYFLISSESGKMQRIRTIKSFADSLGRRGKSR